jgi:hypothetical protein
MSKIPLTATSLVTEIADDLAWRGPSGKPMGHVVLNREQAELLLLILQKQAADGERYRYAVACAVEEVYSLPEIVARFRWARALDSNPLDELRFEHLEATFETIDAGLTKQ